MNLRRIQQRVYGELKQMGQKGKVTREGEDHLLLVAYQRKQRTKFIGMWVQHSLQEDQRRKGETGLIFSEFVIQHGIARVNLDTDLRLASTVGVREALARTPKGFDPRKILGPARDLMGKLVEHRMHVLGFVGQA